MTPDLPAAVETYFAAKNRHDINAMLQPFSPAAVVHDEGETHSGPAIRQWMEATTAKYRVTAEPVAADRQGDVLVVAAQVTGDFPGSPARLTYRFTLAPEGIVGLRIG